VLYLEISFSDSICASLWHLAIFNVESSAGWLWPLGEVATWCEGDVLSEKLEVVWAKGPGKLIVLETLATVF
jgi:hypothetical protein